MSAVYHVPGCGGQLPDCSCDGYETSFTGEDGIKYVAVKMPAVNWGNLMQLKERESELWLTKARQNGSCAHIIYFKK